MCLQSYLVLCQISEKFRNIKIEVNNTVHIEQLVNYSQSSYIKIRRSFRHHVHSAEL